MKNHQIESVSEEHEKLYIFDTHPIQYRSPVFAALSKKLPSLRVFFFNEAFHGKRCRGQA